MLDLTVLRQVGFALRARLTGTIPVDGAEHSATIRSVMAAALAGAALGEKFADLRNEFDGDSQVHHPSLMIAGEGCPL